MIMISAGDTVLYWEEYDNDTHVEPPFLACHAYYTTVS